MAKENIPFSSLEAFRAFEELHPEQGLFFKAMKIGKLYDVVPSHYLELDTIVLSFGEYEDDPLYLLWSSRTQEIFMGSVNDGGHATRFRAMRINRNDIYESAGTLLDWAENRSYNMWCCTATYVEKTEG